MIRGRRPRSEPLGTALPDGEQFLDADIDVPLPLLALEAFAQRHGDRSDHGLTRESGELADQPAGSS